MGRPYSMFDPDELHSHVTLAGFSTANIEKVTLYGDSPSALDIAKGFTEGNSIVNEIMKEGPELLDQIQSTIAKKINEHVSKDPVRSKLNAWVGEAFK